MGFFVIKDIEMVEDIDPGALHALMWFFAGVFSYRILAKLLNYGYMVNMFTEMLVSVLLMLRLSDEYMQKGNEFLKDASLKSGKDKETVDKEQEANLAALELCRSLAIATIISTTPRHYRGLLRFNDWNEAMRLLKNAGGYDVFRQQEER